MTRTSETLQRLLADAKDTRARDLRQVMSMHPDRFIEFCEKYFKMEETLQYIYDGHQSEHVPGWIVLRSKTALDYDPVPSYPPIADL